MKHIKTINKANLKKTAAKGGCGKCQASCQSACKTSAQLLTRSAREKLNIPIFLRRASVHTPC